MLIESGHAPILAPCHISTEAWTNAQAQIPAAGRFLAEGISHVSQRRTNADRNMTPQAQTYRRFAKETLIIAKIDQYVDMSAVRTSGTQWVVSV